MNLKIIVLFDRNIHKCFDIAYIELNNDNHLILCFRLIIFNVTFMII